MGAPQKAIVTDQFTENAVRQSMGISNGLIYSSAMDILRKYNLKHGQLLDFGAGQGAFAKALRDNFKFTLHGVDLMFTEAEQVNWYVQDLNRPLQFKEDQFDVVTCIEVIEHLENPRRVVRDLFRVLKPGGRCILTTPNNDNWRAVLSYVVNGHFFAFTDSSYPAHITAVNHMDLMRIFTEAGFSEIEFSYTNDGMVPKSGGMTWQKLSFGKLVGKYFSDNVLVTAKKT